MITPLEAFNSWLENKKVYMKWEAYSTTELASFYIVDIERSTSTGKYSPNAPMFCTLANKPKELRHKNDFKQLSDKYHISNISLNKA